MSISLIAYRVLIASPSDVKLERTCLQQLIYEWNALNSEAKGIVLLPIAWETHSYPAMGDRPQAILNKQIVENSDILIGVFWTRVGTSTGVADSGTLEEIMHFSNTGKPIQLYFSLAPIPQENLDFSQHRRLQSVKNEFCTQGLICEYKDLGDFRDKARRNIAKLVDELNYNSSNSIVPSNSNLRETLIAELRKFILKSEAIWDAEKSTSIGNIAEGKNILNSIFDFLVNFKAELLDSDEKLKKEIQVVLIQLRELTNHTFALDGGASYRAFWDKGELLFKDIKEIPNTQESLKL